MGDVKKQITVNTYSKNLYRLVYVCVRVCVCVCVCAKVVIKVSDEGGGIKRSNMNRIWSYLYTTADPAILDRMLGKHTSYTVLFYLFYPALLCPVLPSLLCYAMLCYAMLCYAMLCYAMLCYAMLCYAMLCYAMLCYALLYPTLLYPDLTCTCDKDFLFFLLTLLPLSYLCHLAFTSSFSSPTPTQLNIFPLLSRIITYLLSFSHCPFFTSSPSS